MAIEAHQCIRCDRDISHRHGSAKRCEPCVVAYRNEYRREHRKKPGVREKEIEWQVGYRKRPSAQKSIKEYGLKRSRLPAEKAKRHAYMEQYRKREDVRERAKETQRIWMRDPDRRKKHRERQRLRKPWDSTVTAESVAAMLEAQRGRCIYCKARISDTYRMDHIVPLAKGGPSTLSNLQLICNFCNGSKHAQDPMVFARKLGQLL